MKTRYFHLLLLGAIVFVCFGCGTDALKLPNGTQTFNDLSVSSLKRQLGKGQWDSVVKTLFGEKVYDEKLPDIVVYHSKSGNWSSGFRYKSNPSTSEDNSAQHFFGEKNVWVVLLSDEDLRVLNGDSVRTIINDTTIASNGGTATSTVEYDNILNIGDTTQNTVTTIKSRIGDSTIVKTTDSTRLLVYKKPVKKTSSLS